MCIRDRVLWGQVILGVRQDQGSLGGLEDLAYNRYNHRGNNQDLAYTAKVYTMEASLNSQSNSPFIYRQ